jgi:hypothetical protein
MTRAGVALSAVLLLVVSSIAGCNKAPAVEALAEVESSLEASRPTLERHNPEDLRRLAGAVTEARRSLDEGRYTEALKVAQRLPSRIDAALVGALARRDALAADWDEVSAPLPGLLARLRRRVARLGPPVPTEQGAAPEPAWHARARADMAALDRAWAWARARYEEGDAPAATAAAREVASGARDLGARLGLDLSRRPVPAGDEGEGTAADVPSPPPTPLPMSPDPTVEEG